ncbi:MAG: hypothetical protein QW651_07745 [Candidatus Nezhaarchaeales archaeon]
MDCHKREVLPLILVEGLQFEGFKLLLGFTLGIALNTSTLFSARSVGWLYR